MKTTPVLLVVAVLLATPQLSPGAAPTAVNYQGRFTNAAGIPQPGIKAMSLKIYDTLTDGIVLYSETVGNVTVDASGVYSFQFGANGAGTPASLTYALAPSAEQFLELTVDGAAQTPRQKILAVPFALVASGLPDGAISSAMIADGAVGLSKITGLGTAATANTGTTSGTIPLLTTGGKLPSGIVDNAAVNAAVLENPAASQLAFGIPQNNNLGTATTAFRGATKDIRMVTFGDSLVNNPPLNLAATFAQAGGYARADDSVGVSGGSSLGTDWAYPGGRYVSLPSGSYRRWGVYNVTAATYPFMRASRFKVRYVIGPGTLRLRASSGLSSTFTDITTASSPQNAYATVNHTAIDTSVGTPGAIGERIVSMYYSDFYRIETASDSGTIKVLSVEAYEDAVKGGYRVINLGLGGSYDTGWVQTTQTNWTAILSSIAPQIVVFKAATFHITDNGTNWRTTIDRMRVALPNAMFLLVGTHPWDQPGTGGIESPDPNTDPSGFDAQMKAYAIANSPQVVFADIRRFWPTYSNMLSTGLIAADGIHLTDGVGTAYQNALLNHYVPTLVGPQEVNTSLNQPIMSSLTDVSGVVRSGYGKGPNWTVSGDLFNANGYIGFSSVRNQAGSWGTGPHFTAFASGGANAKTAGGFALGESAVSHRLVYSGRLGGRAMIAGFGNAETNLTRDISGELEVLASNSTTKPALVVSVPSGQTADMMEFRTASSLSATGTKASGVRFDGIPFIPSFTATARDALTGVPAGSVILNTTSSKLNFYTGSAWEAVTSAP